MTSYFEKLTSINTSSLNLHKQLKDSSQRPGGAAASATLDLPSALDKIEELKRLNTKLDLDLKCEHDEKADLVSLKIDLENQVLNLREHNERLEFQVESLKVEKDKIHHVLAKFREEGGSGSGSGERPPGLFIASSGGGSSGAGVMKKFPSLDDLTSSATNSPLFMSPSSSPPPGLVRVTTPTSIASGGPLERITEEDETLLESLVLSNANTNSERQQCPSASSSKLTQQPARIDDLLKKIAFLEAENVRLTRKKFICSKCKRRSNGRRNPGAGLIFEDEGLVLSAVDDYEDDEDEEGDHGASSDEHDDDGYGDEHGAAGGNRGRGLGLAMNPSNEMKAQANSILEMQRKIIKKLERELDRIDGDAQAEISRLKQELERRMSGIVWIAKEEQSSEEESIGAAGNGETAEEPQQKRDG